MSIELLKITWAILSFSLVPIAIWYFITFKKVTRHLKAKHEEIWNALGKVGFINNNNINNSNQFIWFLINRKYTTLKDDELIKDAQLCRSLLILGFALSTLAFVMPILIGKYS